MVEPFGKVYTWEIKCPLMGKTGTKLAESIIIALDLPLSSEEYLNRVEKQYMHFFPQAVLLPGRVGKEYCKFVLLCTLCI